MRILKNVPTSKYLDSSVSSKNIDILESNESQTSKPACPPVVVNHEIKIPGSPRKYRLELPEALNKQEPAPLKSFHSSQGQGDDAKLRHQSKVIEYKSNNRRHFS